MFKNLVFILIIFVFSINVGLCKTTKKDDSVTEKILNILIEKNIIDEKQYNELLSQLKQKKEANKVESQNKIRCGYNKGFYIETKDKENKIRISGRFQGDAKVYFGNHSENDSFFIRRARLATLGTFHKYFDFMVEAEFGRGNSKLNDGFMNIHFWKEFQIMFGQFKAPFWMEELTSDNWIDFIERSLADQLAPSRDLGIMFHGSLMEDAVYYQVGLINGYRMNEASDADNGKDVATRIVVQHLKIPL